MLQNVSGLTGGSDDGRCPFRLACRAWEFLLPRYHVVPREDRTMDVVSGQWELAIWTLANWAAARHGVVTFRHGEALVKCPVCQRLVPYASEVVADSGIVFCRSAFCWGADRPIQALAGISNSAMNDAYGACRRLAGGVRSYPMLRGMQVQLQAPVLHCTGMISKQLVHFILACLPEDVATISRQVICAIMSKGKVESLYLREYRELVAAAVACPAIFTEDLDPALSAMLQLVQLLNAAWRGSLADPTDVDRSGAAAMCHLAALVLGPLYLNLKPLDPVTKSAKVTTLYLHAPLAHVRYRVSTKRGGPAVVTDDNMEGHLRGVGRYVYNNANNASQAALFSDLAAVRDASLAFATARSHPSSLVYTKQVRICKCWTSLSDEGDRDFAAIRKVVQDDPELTMEEDEPDDVLTVILPLHETADANGQKRLSSSGKPLLGKHASLRRGLRFRQREVTACHCGRLTGGNKSRLVQFLLEKRARMAADAEAVAAEAGTGDAGQAATSHPGSVEAPASASAVDIADSDAQSDDAGGAMSASSGGSDTGNETPVDAPPGVSGRPRQPKPTARATLVATMPSNVPPGWVLRLALPDAVASAVRAEGEVAESTAPSFDQRDAELRKQVTVMRLLLLRTRSYEFVSWSVTEGIPRDDLIEAARRILDRLVSVRTELILSSRR